MPKKGGKKSAKLSNMSEEERLLFMQQKALAEEELSKKKEDILTQFLKDKLAKEEKSSVLNLNKINQQWRVLMRETKGRELKKDIEVLSQTFERVVDRKDSVIKSLAWDLEEAEAQYSQALRAHLHNLDVLLQLQRGRLESLEQNYQAELEALRGEFHTERELILSQHQQECTHLEDISFAMEQNYSEQENDVKQDFHSVRDEIRNKNIEEKHALRIQLEGTVEELWRHFQQALRSYNETTEERKSAFEALRGRDEKSAKEIEMQMKKIQKLQDSIALVRSRLASNARESEKQNRRLQEEKEAIQGHFHTIKTQMNWARACERGQLAKLTLHSNAAIKKLQQLIEKGDHVLRLTEMCRKLETEEEKVLPFYSSSLSAEEQSQEQAAAMEPPTEQLAQAMQDYTALERFWQRYNKALLEQLALEREKAVLAQENAQLRQLLKQYLDGISVSDDTLGQLNPLFIVNQRTNARLPAVPLSEGRVARHTHTVIEAAHIVQHTI
ncbi:dynein regulatory complex subunit 2 [Huso huso]|uniref:Dynein regulatory complex protein 1 n=1 Tax=Huso huso TaxID=61971 RepID=A0ABR0Y3D6_HUSHU